MIFKGAGCPGARLCRSDQPQQLRSPDAQDSSTRLDIPDVLRLVPPRPHTAALQESAEAAFCKTAIQFKKENLSRAVGRENAGWKIFPPARFLFQVHLVSTDELVKAMGLAKAVPRFA